MAQKSSYKKELQTKKKTNIKDEVFLKKGGVKADQVLHLPLLVLQ